MKLHKLGSLVSVLGIMVAASTAVACPDCKKGYVFGTPVAVGNGMAFTWAKLEPGTNKILSLGVTLTETALEGLPEMEDSKMPMMEYALELPAQIKGKPFDHVSLDWNPKGHHPNEIYGKPHFDFHFYTISRAERQKITATGKDLDKCKKQPEPRFIPQGYILPPDTQVPTMGTHWIHPESPELSGQPFTTTFLYGSYNGKSAFWEPMITRDFLLSKPNFTAEIPQPKAFQVTGFYPTSYSVKHNATRKEITISLDEMVWAKAAGPQTLTPIVAKPAAKSTKVASKSK